MPNVRLILEYDGTDFHGWQKQPGLRTVQGIVEGAISRISGEKPKLIGSGRTDAGVHARGQVANFLTEASLACGEWRKALNANLPPDVVVLRADRAPKEFHARHSAVGRVYEYRVLRREVRSPLDLRFAWHVPRPLDISAIRKASVLLRGVHDFTSFSASGSENQNPRVNLRRLGIGRSGELLLFTLEASHFLWHMVRNIVGLLVEVGLGRIHPGKTSQFLGARDRRAVPAAPAPPQGLCLIKVQYPRLPPSN
ncbi:MAG TPA: tRNA pseudouridine(38-40) synthase TruA [Nitrospiria bacterium]|nr:tRNA pseudouridine(38-40) synthase TruA [Nitrospiria bacterium]